MFTYCLCPGFLIAYLAYRSEISGTEVAGKYVQQPGSVYICFHGELLD